MEGEAAVVTDPATVARMAARWAAGGWPARADDTGLALTAEFSAPSAGPPPWHVYRLTPRAATALSGVGAGGVRSFLAAAAAHQRSAGTERGQGTAMAVVPAVRSCESARPRGGGLHG